MSLRCATVSTPSRVVYRALVGGYERLREEEVAHDSDLPFICFTDDPELTSDTWQVEVVAPRLLRDATRSARALKILGHPSLDDADVGAPLHSYRTSVLGEAEAVLDVGLDDLSRV